MITVEGVTVDLTSCDREPIHILGAVQPFGFLIAPKVAPDTGLGIVRRADGGIALMLPGINSEADETAPDLEIVYMLWSPRRCDGGQDGCIGPSWPLRWVGWMGDGPIGWPSPGRLPG